MKQTHGDGTKEKATVKFKMSDSEDNDNLSEASKAENRSVIYNSVETAKGFALKTFNECDTLFRNFTENDPYAKKSDTVSGIIMILRKLKEMLNKAPQSDKEDLFHLVYNCSLYIFDYCRVLRKSIYGLLCIPYLKEILIGMESNIVLLKSKYLEWRVKVYIEIIRIYEENGSLKCAQELASRAADTIKKQKDLEELDPPVPDYSRRIYQKCQHYLNSLTLKFQVQSGELKLEQLKAKLKDLFPKEEDSKAKMLTLIEILTVNNKSYNVMQHDGKKDSWKEQLVDYTYDLVKGDLGFLVTNLEKRFKDLNDRGEFLQTIRSREQKDFLKTNFDQRLGLLSDEKKVARISEDFPLDLHFELMKHAFDVQKQAVFSDLLGFAFKRCDYRRIEVPYISDLDFEVSRDMDINVRNGYEKIPIDLNEAYLKQEITKLRNKRQVEPQDEEEEEAKPDPKKAKPTAGKKKDGLEEDNLDGQLIITPTGFKFKKKELEKVNHQFTYLVMKKSPSPKQAIFDIQIVIGDEHKEPAQFKDAGWTCVAIPIEQYTGVKATFNTVPYLCFKRSTTALMDENEKKTILSDIRPLISKSSLVRPDYKYHKLETDLRQVPKEFGKMSNIDYVYLSYKTDGDFFRTERLTYIFDALNRLENTLGKIKVNSFTEEARLLLLANFGFEEFRDLANVLTRSLEGPLGDELLSQEYDILFKLSFHVWKTFIGPLLVQIDHYFYLKAQGEIDLLEQETYAKIIDDSLVPSFIELLQIFLKIAEANDYEQDIIWICKMALELGKLLEQQARFKEAAQTLRTAFDRITWFRDEKLHRRLRSKLDLLLPFSLTCSNAKIEAMFGQMKTKYFEWKLSLERTIRQTRRRKAKKKALNPKEEDEEEDEVLRYTKQFYNDDFRDESTFEKISQKQISDLDLVVNALHVDISICLFRNELNDGLQRDKKKESKADTLRASNPDEIQLIKEQQGLQGIAYNLIRKINLMNEPHSKAIQMNTKTLQLGMQKAGMMDLQKPELADYEKKLLKEAGDNTYLGALLYIVMAMNRSSESEQQQLLGEALKLITQCESLEERLITEGINNSPEVLSTLFEDKLLKLSSEKVHPFSAMAKDEYIPETKVPRTPILLSKTSTSMVFKLPVFKPKIPEEILLEDPSKGVVASMAIYGKRANNTAVSITSTDLSNTGIHYQMNSIVRVPNLSHNSKYSFAVAAFDPEQNISNAIGETLLNVHTSQPMPINLLYNYLAKIAFQLDDTETALKAARGGCELFVEKSLVKERLLNGQYHPILQYRVNPAKVRLISGLEMRAASESLLIWSLCLSVVDPEKGKKDLAINPNITRDRQKEVLEISNLRLLAIELAIPCQAYDLARIAILELYNSLGEFFQMKTLSRLIFQVLTKVNMAISLIPKHFWDDLLRKVSAKMSYQLICLSLQLNEFFFSKRVLYTEIKIPRRKYGLKSSVEMVEYVDPAKAKKPTGTKPKKDAVEDEEKKMVPQFTRDIQEKDTYQPFFEEFLLTVHEDYYNFADYFQDYWTDHLNSLSDKLTSDDKLNAARTDLNRIVEFYSLFFDVGSMKGKIEATSSKTERFIEYLAKLGRRLVEANVDNEFTKDIRKQISEYKVHRKPDESHSLVENLISLKFQAYEADVDWNPAGLNALIQEEEVNQTGNKVAIDIFTAYFELQNKLVTSMEANWAGFRYLRLWSSEVCYLNATSLYLMFRQSRTQKRPTTVISPVDINELDIEDSKLAAAKEKGLESRVDIDTRSMASAKSGNSTELKSILKTFSDEKDFSDSQYELLDKTFEFLAMAAVEAFTGRCYRQLQNIISTAINILNEEGIRPIEVSKRDSWKHLTLLADCGLLMVQDIKETRGFFDDDNTNVFGNKKFFASFFKVEKDNDKGLTGLDPLEEKKKFWFQNMPQLKIVTIANLVGFVAQVLLLKEKWSVLISLTKTLSNATAHYFSRATLPFTIAAQEVLVQAATDKKAAKLEDKRLCEERHNQWKKTREKSRAHKIKLEVPKEQLQYDKDIEVLNEQIKMCRYKETLYKGDKEQAAAIKKDIDAEVKESLAALRILQRQAALLANSDRRLHEACKLRPVHEFESARKAIVKEAESLIKQYKSLIDGSMRKKKETYLAAVALHDLGNLCHLAGDYDQACVAWNESIDQVFQKSSSVKGYADILSGNSKTVQEYGARELLIVIIILGKLAIHSYHKDVGSRKLCVLMACGIAHDFLQISLEHPQNIRDLGTYSLSSLGVENLFSERRSLDAADLLMYAVQLCSLALDFEAYFEVLPLACISEYLANHQCNSQALSVRSKLIKSLSLSGVGLVNESIVNLLRVYYEKDMPVGSVQRPSESLKLKTGANYSFSTDMQYQNDLTPNDTRNSAVVDKLADLKLSDVQFFRLGPSNANLFSYAKYCLLFTILKLENLDITSYIDLRRSKLESVVDGLGEVIKRLCFEERLAMYTTSSSLIKYMGQAAPELASAETEAKFLKQIEMSAVHFIGTTDYADLKDHYIKAIDYSTPPEDQRRDRGTLIVACYVLQAKVLSTLNSFSASYFCLRDCLSNLEKLAQERVYLEYNPPVIEATQEDDDPKKKGKVKDDKKADTKKQPPAAAKKKTGKGAVEEEFTEEDFQVITVRLTALFEKVSRDVATQKGIHAHLWLKVKSELANSLFFMKRWTGLLDFIDGLSEDSSRLNDCWYKRKALELKVRTLVIQGKKKDAIDVSKQIKEIRDKNDDKDVTSGLFLADLGEFYFLEKDYEKALDHFEKSRAIFLKYLKNYIEEFDFWNINTRFEGEKIVTELVENKYDIEQKLGRERIEKGGKGKPGDKQKQKKDDKKSAKDASGPSQDIGTLFPISEIVSLKDQKLTLVLPDEQQDKAVNSSMEYVCIYAPELEYYAKANHRISLTLMILYTFEQNSPQIVNQKIKLQEIINRLHLLNAENSFILRKNYFVNTSIKLASEFFIGETMKFEAMFKFATLQAEIIADHQKDNPSSKVQKIIQHLPYKNFSLRKYIIKVPMFTKFLRETFLPLLDKAKSHLLRSVGFLKGECLLQEFAFKPSDIFRSLAEIDLLVTEYRPNLAYRYVSHDEIRQYGLIKGQKKLFQDQDIYEKIEQETKKDSDLQNLLIWEAIEYIKISINVDRLMKKMREEYNKLGDDPADFIDVSKMNKDIRQEVLEARKLVESEKNWKNPFPRNKVSKVDLITYLTKLHNESKLFSFQNAFAQKQIIKLHKFLAANLKSYMVEFPVDNYEVKNTNAVTGDGASEKLIPARTIAIKGHIDKLRDEYGFLYVLGKLDENQAKAKKEQFQNEADFTSILHNSDKPLYGYFHASKDAVKDLLLNFLELKQQMIISNSKSEDAKNRDYKIHEEKMVDLFSKIGLLFNTKGNPFKKETLTMKSEQQVESEVDVFGKAVVFMPKVDKDTVDVMIKIFSGEGVYHDSNDILAIFRQFHSLKYK